MILMIVLLVLLFLLLLLLFYPLRFTVTVRYQNGADTEKVILHPVLMIRKIGFTVYDSERPKEQKQKKPKKTAPEKQEPKGRKKLKPLYELFLDVLNLLGRFKKGLKWLRIRLKLRYGFPDPALTGEITGALYATLPPLCGDMRRCHWRLHLYPVWCTEETCAAVDGDIRICGFDLIFAFGSMIPSILKILPKKMKKTEEVK